MQTKQNKELIQHMPWSGMCLDTPGKAGLHHGNGDLRR